MPGASGLPPAMLQRRTAQQAARKAGPVEPRELPWNWSDPPTGTGLDPELAAALATSQPTGPIRRSLAERDRTAAEAEAKRRQAEAEREAEAVDTIEDAASELADQAALRIVEAVSDPLISADEALAAVSDDALAVAQAQWHLDRALGELAEAEATVAALDARLRTASSARSEILARRRSGGERPDDGEVVALLDLDGEGLRSLLTQAEAVVVARHAPVAEARTLVVQASAMLRRSEDETALAALMRRADRQAAELSEALTRLEEARSRCGQRPTWSPGMPLWRQIRKQASFAGLL